MEIKSWHWKLFQKVPTTQRALCNKSHASDLSSVRWTLGPIWSKLRVIDSIELKSVESAQRPKLVYERGTLKKSCREITFADVESMKKTAATPMVSISTPSYIPLIHAIENAIKSKLTNGESEMDSNLLAHHQEHTKMSLHWWCNTLEYLIVSE